MKKRLRGLLSSARCLIGREWVTLLGGVASAVWSVVEVCAADGRPEMLGLAMLLAFLSGIQWASAFWGHAYWHLNVDYGDLVEKMDHGAHVLAMLAPITKRLSTPGDKLLLTAVKTDGDEREDVLSLTAEYIPHLEDPTGVEP